MKKKQLLGILLAGTMMVGAAVPVFAADGDRVKITYAQWGNETETAATQAVADKFNSEQDKIEVEVEDRSRYLRYQAECHGYSW